MSMHRSLRLALLSLTLFGMTTTPVTQATATAAESPKRTLKKASVTKRPYGKVGNANVHVYTLTNQNGLVLKAITYGAIVTELHLPDRDGKFADVVLGFDKLADYVTADSHFGALIGRVANRIKGATFTLNGATHKLGANNGPDHLHGGPLGWDRKIWKAESAVGAEGPTLTLTSTSPDGDEAYPGTVQAKVVYTLTNDNQFRIDMEATTDKATLVNLAHHGYWNLGGPKGGTVLDHELIIEARRYTPGAPLIPDGKVAPVAGTPFDFTSSKPIGRDLKAIGNVPLGYDVNYVVDGSPDELRAVARVKEPKSGRVMMIESNQPGVQFYTSNYLDGSSKGKGMVHQQHSGFCLETQKFPNAINVPAWKDQAVLVPGKIYKHQMIHRFTTE